MKNEDIVDDIQCNLRCNISIGHSLIQCQRAGARSFQRKPEPELVKIPKKGSQEPGARPYKGELDQETVKDIYENGSQDWEPMIKVGGSTTLRVPSIKKLSYLKQDDINFIGIDKSF